MFRIIEIVHDGSDYFCTNTYDKISTRMNCEMDSISSEPAPDSIVKCALSVSRALDRALNQKFEREPLGCEKDCKDIITYNKESRFEEVCVKKYFDDFMEKRSVDPESKIGMFISNIIIPLIKLIRVVHYNADVEKNEKDIDNIYTASCKDQAESVSSRNKQKLSTAKTGFKTYLDSYKEILSNSVKIVYEESKKNNSGIKKFLN